MLFPEGQDTPTLISQFITYPDSFINGCDALEVMDDLMALNTKSNNLDDAREYIKALEPQIKDDQIEYDSEMNPVGVSEAHTPFPTFHQKCRTTTIVSI